MLDFENYPIIAAVKTEGELEKAVISTVEAVFVLNSNLLSIQEIIDIVHSNNKQVYIHVDFVEGLSNDASGVKFLAKMGVDGIISTRSNVISAASECGISSVQRFFMLDSRSVDTALDTLCHSKADMVEIMPGVATKAIERIKRRTSIPIIAGGLIDKKEEIFSALRAGASMISTGKSELWDE